MEQAKTAATDAVSVVARLASDPVAGLSAAYAQLGPDRALGAGIGLWIAFALTAAAGLLLGANQLDGVMPIWFVQRQRAGGSGFATFIATTLRSLVVPAALAVVSLALRKMAGARPPAAADVFVAGASLAPLGAAMLLAGMIGIANFEVILLVLFFAVSYLVLMLFGGITGIGEISPRAAAPAVPAAILLAAWVCKVLVVAI